MAVIEVCDICDKKVDMSDGITLKCSDNKGFSFICGDAVRHERNYDVNAKKKSSGQSLRKDLSFAIEHFAYDMRDCLEHFLMHLQSIGRMVVLQD